MTHTSSMAPGSGRPTCLSTDAARNLASTTKSRPFMEGIGPRWLLQLLPWVEVPGGTYRVNRRLRHELGQGRVGFVSSGPDIELVPQTLVEVPLLRGLDDDATLSAIAASFTRREHAAGDMIVCAGARSEHLLVIAYGKAERSSTGKFGDKVMLGVLSDGDHFGETALLDEQTWKFSVQAVTRCVVFEVARPTFAELVSRSAPLSAHIRRFTQKKPERDAHGQAHIALSAGHTGETELPATFVDYELAPREYSLQVAQTVLRIHARVADLYNDPMDQITEQLRSTVEALYERQEHELCNDPAIGLLHNVDPKQRLRSRCGSPTPEDLDDLLSRRRGSRFFLAHPRAIAAFGAQCNKRGIYPKPSDVAGQSMMSWRGVPLVPCDKIPILENQTTSILVLRTGQERQGVVGLRQTGIPDEHEPGLNVRFMGIDDRAALSYLVSTYYSVAVLVPDALGMLEDVVVGR